MSIIITLVFTESKDKRSRTAGVFLITRSSPVFEFAPGILNVITIAGSCTASYAATIGMRQNDLKRVIAYSTCSHLGYMLFAC